jgi:uncharacterized protein (DUF697 family)
MEHQTPPVNDQTKAADKLIRSHMAWAMGAGLIPVPIADFFAVGAIQLDMIRQLCKVYQIDFKETDSKAIISALTGSGLARLGAQAVKLIPGVGSIVGGMTMSVLSGASTYAVGEVFKKHFETGGTILDFEVERLSKMYNDLFEKGKKVAKEMKEDEAIKKDAQPTAPQDSATPSPNDDVIRRIRDLADMKDKGLITDEEYHTLKRKIIGA